MKKFTFFITLILIIMILASCADETGEQGDTGDGRETEAPVVTDVTVGGKLFPKDAAEIVLDEVPSADVLIAALGDFESLTTVSFGENVIDASLKDAILEKYPGLTVNAVCLYEICGMNVRDDTETLDLTGKSLSEADPEAITRLTALKSLDLHGTNASLGEIGNLRASLPGLTVSAEITYCDQVYDTVTTENIDLSGTEITDIDELRLFISLFQNLKEIVMCDCGIDDETMASIRGEFPDISVVWMLHMGIWSFRTDAVAFSVLVRFPSQCKIIGSDDLEVLKYTTNLQALDVGHQKITDITPIVKYAPGLRLLILADNNISDISPLAELKHLHYLEFFVNKIHDISALAECKELVDLNISYNSLFSIYPITNLPMLERLWLEHTGIPEEQVEMLREIYPNTQIVSVGEGSVDAGWRVHPRYDAMINMFYETDYMNKLFSMYDGEDE